MKTIIVPQGQSICVNDVWYNQGETVEVSDGYQDLFSQSAKVAEQSQPASSRNSKKEKE